MHAPHDPERADLLTRLDERIGNTIEAAIRAEGVSERTARAIRRNKIQQIGDAVIEARAISAAVEQLRAHDKG